MKSRSLNIRGLMLLSVFMISLIGFSNKLDAQTIKPVTVQSTMDFNGTISAIQKAVSDGGLMVLSELNQGKILSMTGLKVNAHSFFIGNPTVGKDAFSADPSVGLVIPVRVNVYEENGKVYVKYFKPSDLFASYENKKVKMIGQKLDGKLDMMMKMLSE
jgi:uncharacterized protein (DUF302 family)